MARPRQLIPGLCRHRGKNLAYVTIEGRVLYLGRWDARRNRPGAEAVAAYRRLCAERLAASGAALADLERPIAVAELVAAHLIAERGERRRPDGRLAGEWATIRGALQYLVDLYPDLDVDQFRPRHLKAVRQRMIEAGLARGTINAHARRIVRLFAWGVVEDAVDPDTVARLRELRGLRAGRGGRETARRQPAAWPQVRAVLRRASRQVRSMILLQWLTGMRPGEVIAMRADRIDTSGDLWVYRLDPGRDKTARAGAADREILIGPRARKVLAPWLTLRPEGFLFRPADAHAAWCAGRRAARATPLYPSHVKRYKRQAARHPRRPAGECYRVDSYRHAIRRACEAAGVALWTPHQLRHAFATRARAAAEGSLDAIAAAMGHADVSTTQIYAKLRREAAEALIREVG